MVLFINGLEPSQWVNYEITVKNSQCYSIARVLPLIAEATVAVYCVSRSFQSNKSGNIYSPERNITAGRPVYQGKSMDYWDKVINKISSSSGFNDNRLFFINGSSDNESTGQYRYRLGIGLGEKIIKAWESKDENSSKSNKVVFAAGTSRSGMSIDQFVYELSMNASNFYLQPRESIKIVAHSQGAAIAAGIAATIDKNPKYKWRLDVVLYLAPHQPGDFSHPAGVPGCQSSSTEDLVATKNNIKFGIPLDWAKGKTSDAHIRNIPHFIENKPDNYKGDFLRGHNISTYKKPIDIFFKDYYHKK